MYFYSILFLTIIKKKNTQGRITQYCNNPTTTSKIYKYILLYIVNDLARKQQETTPPIMYNAYMYLYHVLVL